MNFAIFTANRRFMQTAFAELFKASVACITENNFN